MLDEKKLDKILQNYEDIQNQMLTLSGELEISMRNWQ